MIQILEDIFVTAIVVALLVYLSPLIVAFGIACAFRSIKNKGFAVGH